jgi:hypothetical protein
MKTKISFIVGLAIVMAGLAVQAQNATSQPATPTWTPGPAWSLTPEQLADRQQKVQAVLADLRVKRDNGTINANEKAWLERMEQAGGLCVNGVPRGGGRGAGMGWGGGRGRGWGGGFGLRNGTGPRAQAGSCPLLNSPAQ